MEFTEGYTKVALGLVCSKIAYGYVKNWWNTRQLKDYYVEKATITQDSYEASLPDESDFELDGVDDKKKLPSRHKGHFRQWLVQSGKAKFSTPTKNEANRLVVRKYLYDLCKEQGLIARHINEHIDIATELVFVMSRVELEASAISHTYRSKIRERVRLELEGGRPKVA